MTKKFRPLEEDYSPDTLKALDAMGLSPLPTQPLVATGASPISVSDMQRAVLEDNQAVLEAALIECRNYQGWRQFAAVRDDLEVANTVRDAQAAEILKLRLEREVAEERITALDIQLRDADHRIAQLEADLHSDTAHDTANKLAAQLTTARDELRLANEADELHRADFSALAAENKALTRCLKDMQAVVRSASSQLDKAAADHDPTLWRDWDGPAPRMGYS